ncbi:Carbon-nitrogen hydrolase [Datura stramonium]|uniref:Carbon-nitrogen hydrolase n=1 Tax=Datura stramonium TaxID=4076 RepID=A0ABS8RXZ7_DATST|nr:Carbon-nitrogen hydrolase [Datura stramonium]
MSYSARGAHLICTLEHSTWAVDNQLYVASCSPSRIQPVCFLDMGVTPLWLDRWSEIIATTGQESVHCRVIMLRFNGQVNGMKEKNPSDNKDPANLHEVDIQSDDPGNLVGRVGPTMGSIIYNLISPYGFEVIPNDKSNRNAYWGIIQEDSSGGRIYLWFQLWLSNSSDVVLVVDLV